MKNPTFPAIAFLLLAWASIAILTATIITGMKLVIKLWVYLNPPKLVPSAAAIYAPIFETIPPAEFVTVPISNRRLSQTVATSPRKSAGRKSKSTISDLIREEFKAV